MGLSKASAGTFCDHCKMEFGYFDTRFSVWAFRENVNPQAVLTVTSEMSKSNGAVRHYCRYHLQQTQTWPSSKGNTFWPLEEQLAYAKQMEMAEANV